MDTQRPSPCLAQQMPLADDPAVLCLHLVLPTPGRRWTLREALHDLKWAFETARPTRPWVLSLGCPWGMPGSTAGHPPPSSTLAVSPSLELQCKDQPLYCPLPDCVLFSFPGLRGVVRLIPVALTACSVHLLLKLESVEYLLCGRLCSDHNPILLNSLCSDCSPLCVVPLKEWDHVWYVHPPTTQHVEVKSQMSMLKSAHPRLELWSNTVVSQTHNYKSYAYPV